MLMSANMCQSVFATVIANMYLSTTTNVLLAQLLAVLHNHNAALHNHNAAINRDRLNCGIEVKTSIPQTFHYQACLPLSSL